MARGFMIFMWGVDITWGIGRVLSKVEPVLGPETTTRYVLICIKIPIKLLIIWRGANYAI